MGFAFHANTLAFGGQIEEPGVRTKYLPSEASVTLPPGGGIGEAVSGPFSKEGISFESARSYVTGSSFSEQVYNTYAHVEVTDLDINGRIQVQVLSTTVTSMNRRDANGCTGESRISFDANILGLVIDGHLIEVDFNPEPFRRWATFGEFVEAFTTMDPREARELIAAYNWPLDECQTTTQVGNETVTQFHVPRRCTTGIRASLLRRTIPALEPGEISGITRRGYTIEVAGFGLIHLGEVLLKAGRRRLNLLRVELGKTLDSLPILRAPLTDASGEPRLTVAGLDGAPENLTLAGAGGTGGSYTFASGEGNGTDFVP
jgi:hypothetical protein